MFYWYNTFGLESPVSALYPAALEGDFEDMADIAGQLDGVSLVERLSVLEVYRLTF